MTDNTDREKLIQEASDAMHDVYSSCPPFGGLDIEGMARTALAVFEKAHTPTDDEREAITDEALWDFAGDLLDAWNIEDLNPPSLTEMFRDRFVARFRRSEVPEPSAERIGCNICGEALPDGEPHLCSAPQGEPSDAPTRRVAHTGPGHASGDAGYCEGCLAEREQRAAGIIPGEPFTLDDLAREHERLAEHPNQMKQTIPAFHSLTAKALRWAALRAAGVGGVR